MPSWPAAVPPLLVQTVPAPSRLSTPSTPIAEPMTVLALFAQAPDVTAMSPELWNPTKVLPLLRRKVPLPPTRALAIPPLAKEPSANEAMLAVPPVCSYSASAPTALYRLTKVALSVPPERAKREPKDSLVMASVPLLNEPPPSRYSELSKVLVPVTPTVPPPCCINARRPATEPTLRVVRLSVIRSTVSPAAAVVLPYIVSVRAVPVRPLREASAKFTSVVEIAPGSTM